ncbi:UDP-N-acetylmuramoyl-tripeptide--D-alanyl-D-alanine ligase [Thermocrinis sp.]
MRLIGEYREVKRIVIDSRQVEEGDLFIAIKGSRHDGHHFVEEAFLRGAYGVVVEREVNVPEGKFALIVDNTLSFLRSLAKTKREAFGGKVIAIAGSAGKTTTKEMVAFLLSKVEKVCKTPRNQNSQIGVPLSVANFETDCKFWVVELGASQKGDVAKLVDLVKPHVRVITAIGEEHLETFGCLDDVVMGNGEVFKDMTEEDVGVCPQNVSHCYEIPKKITFGDGSELWAQDIRLSKEGVWFKVKGEEVFLPIPSLAVVENALCTFAVLEALGLSWRDLKDHLKDFHPVEGRFKTFQIGKWFVIDDAYNANPPSMRKALQTLSRFESFKIAILGDMLELGEGSPRYHREVGRLCVELGIDLCLFYGEHMRFAWEECIKNNHRAEHFISKEDLVEYLMDFTHLEAVLLLKGSRGMRLEEVLDA